MSGRGSATTRRTAVSRGAVALARPDSGSSTATSWPLFRRGPWRGADDRTSRAVELSPAHGDRSGPDVRGEWFRTGVPATALASAIFALTLAAGLASVARRAAISMPTDPADAEILGVLLLAVTSVMVIAITGLAQSLGQLAGLGAGGGSQCSRHAG